MSERLSVTKTHKLFIGGAFPRSESGRSIAVTGPDGSLVAHLCRASRKDLKAAVEAAHKALPGWSGATAYLRGQILYRMAEMMEGKRAEMAAAVEGCRGAIEPAAEVSSAIDRLIAFAGWADKFQHVLGCHNPVAGPYYNFTVPEPTGIVAVIAPDDAPLLGLISLLAPPLCAGSTIVALAAESCPVVACLLGEVCATSDVPSGAVNILTGYREELVPSIASHREINAVNAAEVSREHEVLLRDGVAENLKRVSIRKGVNWLDDGCESPAWIEPFIEFKTIWHPSGA